MLGVLSFVLVAVAVTYILLMCYALTMKNGIIHNLMPTLPEPIIRLLQPPPSVPVPQQDPLLELIH
jgi:hypothetical protein